MTSWFRVQFRDLGFRVWGSLLSAWPWHSEHSACSFPFAQPPKALNAFSASGFGMRVEVSNNLMFCSEPWSSLMLSKPGFDHGDQQVGGLG